MAAPRGGSRPRIPATEESYRFTRPIGKRSYLGDFEDAAEESDTGDPPHGRKGHAARGETAGKGRIQKGEARGPARASSAEAIAGPRQRGCLEREIYDYAETILNLLNPRGARKYGHFHRRSTRSGT